jgi:UDP-N-acetylmuramate-alanine ligase
MNRIHILGIAGTFMGGVAALARELGHEVEGSDQAVYPPMSTQLERLGIALQQGYAPGNISSGCDEVVVGNALSRGNPAVEQVLDDGRPYTSGAQWLAENVLPGRDTLAVAGTHGKTTTTTILTFVLQAAGREPGFLIGGVAEDFGTSARIGAGREFVVVHDGTDVGEVRWPLLGRHNVMNALAALAAANAVGVDIASVLPAFAGFRSVKRRMEVIGAAGGITVYDDFAHHPTAIATTLAGLRAKVGSARVVVAMEPRSNSMRLGAHADALAPSLDGADVVVFLHRPELAWDAGKVVSALRGEGHDVADADALVAALRGIARDGDHVVFMSNGGFDGAPRRFLAALLQG